MSAEIAIERGGAELIDGFEAIFHSLHDHHVAIAPELAGGPARDRDAAWARRRGRYAAWLAEPGAFALLARRDGETVGCAVVTVEGSYDSWETGEEVGAVHDIAVLPVARGGGVGGRLLDRVAGELAAAEVPRYRLKVLAGNDDAVRFYERHGLRTVTTEMLGSTG